MNSTTVNYGMDQGCNFEQDLYLQDNAGNARNLTNYSVVCQMRRDFFSPVYASITATIPYPTQGVINLSLLPAQTYVIEAGRYVYSVNITSIDGVVTKVADGIITVNPSAIR